MTIQSNIFRKMLVDRKMSNADLRCAGDDSSFASRTCFTGKGSRIRWMLICVALATVLVISGIALADPIRLPSDIREIKEEAFYGDTGIDEVILPDGLQKISALAFAYSGVHRVNIPESVTYIAENAFSGCQDLTLIVERYNAHYDYAIAHDLGAQVISNEEYGIDDISFEAPLLTVSVSTREECELEYQIIDESSKEVLLQKKVPLNGQLFGEAIEIQLPDTIPPFFEFEATFWGMDQCRLTEPWHSVRLTSQYAEFNAKTVDDYAGKVTMDLGAGNYAVLAKGAKDCSSSSRYIGNGVYILPGDSCPVQGDVILVRNYQGEEEPLLVLSAEENPDGTYTVTDDPDASISDLYDVYRLNLTDVGADSGTRKSPSADTVKFEISTHLENEHLEVSVSGIAAIKTEFIYNKELFGEYYEYRQYVEKDLLIEGKIKKEIKPKDNIEIELLPEVVLAGVKGLAALKVKVTMPVTAQLTGSVSFTGQFYSKTGVEKTSNGEKMIRESDFKPDIEGEVSFDIGIGIKVEMIGSLITIKTNKDKEKDLLSASLGISLQFKLHGDLVEIKESELVKLMTGLAEKVHGCYACIHGNGKLEMNASVALKLKLFRENEEGYSEDSFLKGDILKVSFPVFDVELFKYYISVLNDADSLFEGETHMDFGSCPNYRYRTVVQTVNSAGLKVSDIPVRVERDDYGHEKLISEGSSPLTAYLYPGSYTAAATFRGGEETEAFEVNLHSQTVEVKEPPLKITGRVTDNMTDAPVDSAVITVMADQKIIGTAVTDHRGYYELLLGAGEYVFHVEAESYYPKDISYTAETDDTFDFSIKGKYYWISYYTKGINDLSTVTVIGVLQGHAVTEMPEPYPQEGRFIGWNTQMDGLGETVTEGTIPESDMWVYAIWDNGLKAFGKLYSGDPIVWYILEEQEDRMLLLSRDVLIETHYASNVSKNTWAESNVREMLATWYLDQWFTEEEQALILEVSVNNDPAPGTQDKLFILSLDEMRQYFPDESTWLADAKKGVTKAKSKYKTYKYAEFYWVRNSNAGTYDAMGIGTYPVDPWADKPEVSSEGRRSTEHGGIRPALWIRK